MTVESAAGIDAGKFYLDVAVARKIITIANALAKADRLFTENKLEH
jgi:hypothetical protein